jgi:hypothetical protein
VDRRAVVKARGGARARLSGVILNRRLNALEMLIRTAEFDWRSVEPNQLHAAKESLDKGSVRLQEVAITASLKADPR